MTLMKEIASSQNATFKALLKLKDKKGRDQTETFLVEGLAEMTRAEQNGFVLQNVLYCKEYAKDLSSNTLAQLLAKSKDGGLSLSVACYEKLAVRQGFGGLIGVFQYKKRTLPEFAKEKPTLLLILDTVEKPGNLGAICRTAVGGGVDGIFLVGKSVDIYNPNAIRASLGAIFSLPIFNLSYDEAFDFCGEHKLSVALASLATEKKVSLWDYDFKGPVAVVMGNEHHGVHSYWSQGKNTSLWIPMSEGIDSLNVSVASALIVYEAKRQRASRLGK